jgi:hypothetical protein
VKGLLLAAGIASLTQALDRRDFDECARQGVLAGPVVVEKALASSDRNTRLAGIAATPSVEDRTELLATLAKVAAGPDRRSSIPAARAALAIARNLLQHELPDDISADDLETWRSQWLALASSTDHFVEARVLALDIAATLAHATDPHALGFELAPLLADRDPAIRTTAIELIPSPTAPALRGPLANAVIADADPAVALAAAQALCADLVADDPRPILSALGPGGLDRIRTLEGSKRMLRDAARCLPKRRVNDLPSRPH